MHALLLFTALLSSVALAAENQVSYGGSGCPEGSATVSFDAAGNLELKVSTFRIDNVPLRLACAIAWPVAPPAGYALAAPGAEVKGELLLEPSVQSTFNAEIFFSGTQSTPFTLTTKTPGSQNITYLIPAPSTTLSCDAPGILRMNTSIQLQGQSGEKSEFGINTIRLNKAQLVPCKK